jgi:hypothetical protein
LATKNLIHAAVPGPKRRSSTPRDARAELYWMRFFAALRMTAARCSVIDAAPHYRFSRSAVAPAKGRDHRRLRTRTPAPRRLEQRKCLPRQHTFVRCVAARIFGCRGVLLLRSGLDRGYVLPEENLGGRRRSVLRIGRATALRESRVSRSHSTMVRAALSLADAARCVFGTGSAVRVSRRAFVFPARVALHWGQPPSRVATSLMHISRAEPWRHFGDIF